MNRPEDTRCPADAHMIECRTPSAHEPAGVCINCNLGTCSGDGAVMTAEECAVSRRECPTSNPNEVFCPACLAEIVGEAVPEAVEDDGSCEVTTETRTLSDAELMALRQAVA